MRTLRICLWTIVQRFIVFAHRQLLLRDRKIQAFACVL